MDDGPKSLPLVFQCGEVCAPPRAAVKEESCYLLDESGVSEHCRALTPGLASVTSAVTACASWGAPAQTPGALALSSRTALASSDGIASSERPRLAAQWQVALELFAKTRRLTDSKPDTALVNAALSALNRGGRWKE